MALHRLYPSLSARWRPEDVAGPILAVLGGRLPRRLRQRLVRAAGAAQPTSMARAFDAAHDLARQIEVAKGLFPEVPAPRSARDPARLRGYLDDLRVALAVHGTDFQRDRPARAARRALTPDLRGHRAYNKRFRLLRRMEAKYARWLRVRELKALARVGKTRLASAITWEDFARDEVTACFVAWMTARLGLRNQFTWGRQVRAYDEVAEGLFRLLDDRANWKIVAMVHPDPAVIARLPAAERGELLGTWYGVMERSAAVLERLARSGGYDLDTLVVRRGNDSSSWNEAAGAFNKARDGWIATLSALGAEAMLDAHAPGKALRLMAADVVAAHRAWGAGALEPDTQVWQALPKPWDVMAGRAPCTRGDIARACRAARVKGKGWIAPRPKRVARFTPTPELVHGVTVASPALATALRRAGCFSGASKGLRGRLPAFVRRAEGDRVVVEEP